MTDAFYRAGDRLIAVAVGTSPTFTVRARRPLFDVSAYLQRYDVFPDGVRFLMGTLVEAARELIVATNWLDGRR